MVSPNLNNEENVVMVKSDIFLEMVKYINEHSLVDKFNDYLKQDNLDHFALDAKMSNNFKKFLLKERKVDEKGKMAIQCACQNHGPIYIPH